MKKRVLVAMSGGVDSSVAAAILLEQGYEVLGVTMQLWDYAQNEQSCDPTSKFDTCCSLDDVSDARSVAYKLGIPFYVMDYQEDFKRDVVDYFISDYLKGRTPNPCVACNTFLKFDHLMERAKKLRCDFVATGHYAKIVQDERTNEFSLMKGVDPLKDQSYFLYSMNQERLSKILFPLGGMTKVEVRQVAERYGLINAKKKESMEICFIPNNDYASFINNHTSESQLIKGEIYHEDGTKLGDHEGIHQFTVGQRKGHGIASPSGLPLYVTRIEFETGRVYLGEESYLYRTGFVYEKLHFIRPIKDLEELTVKIRYRSVPTPMSFKDGMVVFSTPQKAVTPGQVSVLYSGDEVVGGGFIERVMV